MEFEQIDQQGNRLVSLSRADEASVLREYSPVTHSLVVCLNSDASAVLIVEDRWKSELELPGGSLEEGETLRQCALREFREETGVEPSSLEWYGLLEWELAPDHRTEFGALYRCTLDERPPDMNTDEIGQVLFVDFSSTLRGVSMLDATLARLVREGRYLP